MTSLTFNKTQLSTNYLSNISQESNSTCSSTSSNTISGNIVGGSGLTINGDFTGFTNSFTTDSTCILATTMASTVQNLSLSQMNQTNDNDGTILNGLKWLGVQDNKFTSSTAYTNNVNQVNQSTCSISNVNSVVGNYVYLSNSKVGGDFLGFSSDSDAKGSCGITNQMSSIVYNQAKQDGNQDNVQTGMFVAIAAIFAGIIGVVIFIVIVLFAVGALGYAGYSVTGKKKQAAPGTAGATGAASLSPDDLELANELGISPDVLASGLSPEPIPTSTSVSTNVLPPPPPPISSGPPPTAAAPAAPSKSWSDVAASALASVQKSNAYNNLQTTPSSPAASGSSSLSQTLSSFLSSSAKPVAT